MSGAQLQQPASAPRKTPAARADFSQKAISRAVQKTILQQPYVLYPTAIGLLGGMAALLLGPGMLNISAALLGLGTGMAAWLLDYRLRGSVHANRYLNALHHSLNHQREHFILTLEQDLQQLGMIEGLSQINRLRERYLAFERLLGRKLTPGEITYSRYLGMAEQVYLSALDNLQRLVDVQQGAGAINEVFIRQRLGELKRIKKPSDAQRQELGALESRLELKIRQLSRVEEWLADNEQAITQLDLTMAAIAAMDTVQGQAGIDMESAMTELQRLAAGASAYDRGS